MQGRRVECDDAQDGNVVAAIERDGARRQAFARIELNDCVALAGDDVCSGDDEPVRRDPAGAFHSEAARRAEDADNAPPRLDLLPLERPPSPPPMITLMAQALSCR